MDILYNHMGTKYFFWRFANFYGWVLGWAWLTPLHRLHLNLALHALGYDNARHTGEEWFIKNILTKANPKVCIDVGANVGAYTTMLVDALTCKVYAVEPAAASFKALQTNTVKYGGRVHLVNAAISDHTGTATLYSREELSEKATINATSGAGSALQEQVRVSSLDALVTELGLTSVDFIKIDTEGHELAVFAGMQETIKTLQPAYLQFEFNHVHLYSNTTLYQLSQLLPGYELYRLLPHGWVKIDPINQSSNIFMFCNIVAQRIK